MTAPPPGPPPARDPDEILTGDHPPSAWGGADLGPGPSGSEPPPWRGSATYRTWTWDSSRRSFPWLAVLLLLLGVGLLIELLIPELSFGSLIILAAGGAFLLAWLAGRIIGATVPALVLIAWALSRMATELEVVSGDGWSTLAVGVALVLAWGLGRYQRARREWALWVGLVLGLIGLADVSDTLRFGLDFAIIIALATIALGIYLIWRNRASLVGAPPPAS